MRDRYAVLLFAVMLLPSCGVLGEDDAPPPVQADPALAPVPVPIPEPTPVSQPTTGPVANNGGGFNIPGFPNLPIPLPAPNANRPDPTPPVRGSLPAAPPGSWDASGFMTSAFLDQEAHAIHAALVTALDAHENEQIRAIPFEVIGEPREPNAAAACTRSRDARMVITSAMLELAAGIAEAKAYDELAGTDTYERYVTSVVSQVQHEQPISGVDPRLHQTPTATDPHKLSRQRQLYDMQIAFIVGHELAHHYRGHTNCVAGRSDAEVQRDELAQILAHTVPPFSQPREIEADMWGATNVLEVGRARQGDTWTEEGALLNLDFFRRLTDHGGQELIMAFLSTHPPSALRIPIVRSIAQQWTTGWRPPRMPVPGEQGGPNGPVQLPGLGQLPIDPSQLPIDPSQLPIPFPRGN
jgi:hypothetical protein